MERKSLKDLKPAKKKVTLKRKTAFEAIAVPADSRKDRKRLGRGRSSGHGKTSGKGQKGQKARSGYSYRAGFEGGQMPLHRRLPKRGFTNIFHKLYQVVNVGDLKDLSGDVNPEVLEQKGFIPDSTKLVKVLGNGDLSKKLTIVADAFSASAKEKVEKAGGSLTLRPKHKPAKAAKQ